MATCGLQDRSSLSKGEPPNTISSSPRPPPWVKILLFSTLVLYLAVVGVFVHFYLQFARIIDARLNGNVFDNPAVVLAAPIELQVGQHSTPDEIAAHLRKACYAESQEARGVGSYTVTGNRLEIKPGPESFFRNGQISQGPARLHSCPGQHHIYRAGRPTETETLGL